MFRIVKQLFKKPEEDNDMSRTLVVVDMQAEFAGTAKKCEKEVVKEVQKAKKRGAGIVVLEYDGSGSTFESITKELKGYGRKAYATKHQDDGSKEFLKTAKKHGFGTKKLRVTGVNRCACVLSTIDGIQKKQEKTDVEVAIKATWCMYPKDGRKDLKRVARLK